ncbi:MAG: SMC-Scp complex subunit ScpB [Candidatus Paceibacteria bacterium]
MPLDILIEGLLFYRGTPLKKVSLCKEFDVDEAGLKAAINALTTRLENGALRLIETDTEIMLTTAPTLAPFIEQIRKADLKKDIGKAGAETLAIILYRKSVTRSEIDHIRGVNSSFIIRNLMTRGLIERQPAPKGSGYTFSITPALLAHLGVTRTEELTDFARITDALETFSTEKEASETTV